MTTTTLLLPTLTALSVLLAPDDPLVGKWAGAFRQDGDWTVLEIDITETAAASDPGLEGTLVLPERGVRRPARVSHEEGRITWQVDDAGGSVRARFRGELDGDTLNGRLDGGALPFPSECRLLRVVELDAKARERCVGTYRVDEEAFLRIVPVQWSLGGALGLEFPAEGIRSILHPISPTELVAGSGPAPLPIAARVVLQPDEEGRIDEIELSLGDLVLVCEREEPEESPTIERLQLAAGLDVERRDVSIDSGDVQLAATLYFPPGVERPCPAVVQLHGSAPTRRHTQWHFFTSTCLRCGVAVLAFDKRGCGASTGTFRPFTVAGSAALFDELASDGAAAHAWLCEQEGIDPSRVGLAGGSQAGWIMPLVATKTDQVRFILSACGPTVSAGEEAFHEDWIDRGAGVATADRELEEFAGPRGYDPRPVLRKLETPILWMFGENDDVIPTHACLAELAKLRAEGHLHHDGHVFRNADHNFQTPQGDGVLLEPVITHWLRGLDVLR